MFGEDRIPDPVRDALTQKVFNQMKNIIGEEPVEIKSSSPRNQPRALTPEEALKELADMMKSSGQTPTA